jgi:hypothetical protein
VVLGNEGGVAVTAGVVAVAVGADRTAVGPVVDLVPEGAADGVRVSCWLLQAAAPAATASRRAVRRGMVGGPLTLAAYVAAVNGFRARPGGRVVGP